MMRGTQSASSRREATLGEIAAYDTAIEDERRRTLTDSGNAQRFIARHGADVRYVREFGEWVVWDSNRWKLDIDGAAIRLARDTARSIYAEAAGKNLTTAEAADIAKHAKQSESLRSIRAMLELARSGQGITISQAVLDEDPMLLGVPNGVVDLRQGALVLASRDQFITKQVAVAFDAQATCSAFEAFLSEILDGSHELCGYIARLAGYALTGRTDEQMIAFAYGGGANGKSTLLTTLRGLWGDYGRQSPAETLLSRRDEGIRNDIARLRGARLVTCNETEDGKRLAESMVKQLTGGDPVAARFLHREFFEFTPEFKIILAANHKPVIRGDDLGIWRRIHLLPFTVTIAPERRDKRLADRLRAESAGILAWAVRGCLDWQRGGLRPPSQVLEATREYREEMDLIGAWLAERCIIAASTRVQASVAYNDYSKWLRDRGGPPMSLMSFSRKLTERGFERRKSSNVTFYGVGLAVQPVETSGLRL